MNKQEQIIFDVVAWSYYDELRGQQSANPSCNGLPKDKVESLKSLLPPHLAIKAQIGGKLWAEFELRLDFDSPIRVDGFAPYPDDYFAIAHDYNTDSTPGGALTVR